MKIVKLTEAMAVTEQITPAEVAEIAAAGYRVLVNNRPDAEAEGQPTSREMATAARSAGMDYYHHPITPGSFPGDDFSAFCALLDDPSRPVLAFCRTGTRSTNLWLSSRSAEHRQDAAALAQRAGFDLAMATRYFAALSGNKL